MAFVFSFSSKLPYAVQWLCDGKSFCSFQAAPSTSLAIHVSECEWVWRHARDLKTKRFIFRNLIAPFMSKDNFNGYTQLNMTAYAAVWCGSFTVLERTKKKKRKKKKWETIRTICLSFAMDKTALNTAAAHEWVACALCGWFIVCNYLSATVHSFQLPQKQHKQQQPHCLTNKYFPFFAISNIDFFCSVSVFFCLAKRLWDDQSWIHLDVDLNRIHPK